MYRKFLSLTLLVSIVHALSAIELDVVSEAIIVNNEIAILNDVQTESQEAASLEVQEETPVLIIAENQESEVVTTEEVSGTLNEEVVIDHIIDNEVTEQVVIEPAVNELCFATMMTPKAFEILSKFSEEAKVDFDSFSNDLKKQVIELPEVKNFMIKHETIYAEYKIFKGELPRISIDFFVFNEEEIHVIKTKLDESNAKFKSFLSEENKPKFEAAIRDLPFVIRAILKCTLSEIGMRAFTRELVELDKNQELMVNPRID